MGSIFGGHQSSPPGISMPPPAAHPPTLGSSQVALAGLAARQSSAAAEGQGFDNTINTSPEGLKQNPTTAKATLLGQTGS